ncbi:LCP family protein [Streptoalloteichus hindustanus]|uniref:Transcriptional attenuator, LytR family n=1 Tax=Streptoalloteichus hindustanus TaxID=2017 RepID=A0A1M5GZK7_STRHI|nr:LCP family protein [Streptoalloteichus hindustanus]SHG09203.1 transcriptional attenuator, LytR family [Streptoalloteichus hindustanus]
MVVAVLVMSTFGATWWRLGAAMHRVDGVLPTTEAPNPVGAGRRRAAENVLLIGADSRSGRAGVSGARSDAVVLVRVPADRASVTAVSIPRDAWVDVPSCPRPGGGWTAPYTGMLNSALDTAGPTCTARTVQKLTGMVVTRYVQLDYEGFRAVVDALGGVAVDHPGPGPVSDPDSGLELRPGRNELDGEGALAYVRARCHLGDGADPWRVQWQQRFMLAVARKAASTDVLADPARLREAVSAVLAATTADGQTSLADLERLVSALRSVPPERFVFRTAPIAFPDHEPEPGRAHPADRVLLDVEASRRLFAALAADAPLPE